MRTLKMIRISFNGPWKNLLIVLLISFPQRLHNLMMMCLVYLSLNPKLILCSNFICVSKRVFLYLKQSRSTNHLTLEYKVHIFLTYQG